MHNILVTGSCGQLGSELVIALRKKYGNDNVTATDIRPPVAEIADGPFMHLDVMDESGVDSILKENNITQVYHLAAILSAKAEEKPIFSWDINMKSLLIILESCRNNKIERLFWPSSIAVFGTESPKVNTPQYTTMNPDTVYGISKLAGERWCEYYHKHYGLDVRSLRYPGIISYRTLPGGGTTDYAIDIFHKAVAGKVYSCFLKDDTALPMMFIDDAIRATLELMESPSKNINVRSSYNLAGTTFTPAELTAEILKHKAQFNIEYNPDFRQGIAETWPQSIDDSYARNDWDWQHDYDIEDIVKVMLENV